MKFVHGEFDIALSGNIMLTQAYGPWNAECVVAFGEAYRIERQLLKADTWSDIVILRGESLLIPDAERVLGVRIAAVVPLGLKKVAIVTAESSVSVTARMQLTRMYDSLDVEYDFFTTYSEAKAWLEEAGFSTSAQSEQAFCAHLPASVL
ncbi:MULTISPECIES: hypothetical protein [unclassified Alteromonas]|uniref:hypothetical protein n=1 Tax=unclassified Alteromonas TaxID=2614992 RepID=UPI000C363502|nr:hypothetical protein [Alteromonas sp. RKMC-009]AYA66084.1 hypothetical protein DS731_19855 [Alteromonas sp. RKMC-009]MBT79529.1 hypothetical protein [Alteromonadaceae bacterium]MEC7689538.1 hypothetical protein [Pseudomonadota bacterium]